MRRLRHVGSVVFVAVIASAVLGLLFGAPLSALPSAVLSLLPAVLIFLLPILFVVQLLRWVFTHSRGT